MARPHGEPVSSRHDLDVELDDDEDGSEPTTTYRYVEDRPRRRGRRVLLGLLVAGLLVAVLAIVWIQRQIDPPGPTGEEISITIPKGSSTARIAAILDEKGVIRSATAFRYYLRVTGSDPFEAGDYTLRKNQPFGDVVSTLRKGGEIAFDRITVPEGKTLKEIAALVGKLPGRSAQRFLDLAASGEIRSAYQPPGSNNLEGLLFPDTYFIEAKDDERSILQRMVTSFDDQARAAGIDNVRGIEPYKALIVASLVETEGKVDADRPKIARVVYNRLNKGMLLQIDATVIYARGGVRRPDGRVLFSDLEVDSPYNTYKYKGLPPTPIAAPGVAALRAAITPEPGPWLFYVKFQHDGTHAFATTNAEHNRNIADAKRRGVNP